MKKQVNPESSLGVKELENGALEWTTPNFDIYISNPEVGEKYSVLIFDSSKKDNDEAFIEGQEFDFWYEVLEYIECWN